jgi:hypothetical protein
MKFVHRFKTFIYVAMVKKTVSAEGRHCGGVRFFGVMNKVNDGRKLGGEAPKKVSRGALAQ